MGQMHLCQAYLQWLSMRWMRCNIYWLGAMVVDSHPQFLQKCSLKTWHIHSQDNIMSRDADPLLLDYNPLIQWCDNIAYTIH